MAKDKALLAIAITEKTESSFGDAYYHVRAIVRQYRPNEHGAADRDGYAWPDDEYQPVNGWSDLGFTISAQGDKDSRIAAETRPDRGVYGWDITYRDLHSADLRKITRWHKTLTAIERNLDKLNERRGRARSFGEYVGRIAEIIGADKILIERPKDQRSVTGQHYRHHDIGDGINAIDNMIHIWAQRDRMTA